MKRLFTCLSFMEALVAIDSTDGDMPPMDDLLKLAGSNGLDKTNPNLANQLKSAMAGILKTPDDPQYEKQHGLTSYGNMGDAEDNMPMKPGGDGSPPSFGAPPGLQGGGGDFGSFQAAANSNVFKKTGEAAEALEDRLDAEEARKDTLEANRIREARGDPTVPPPTLPAGVADSPSMDASKQDFTAEAKTMGIDIGSLGKGNGVPNGNSKTATSPLQPRPGVPSPVGAPSLTSLHSELATALTDVDTLIASQDRRLIDGTGDSQELRRKLDEVLKQNEELKSEIKKLESHHEKANPEDASGGTTTVRLRPVLTEPTHTHRHIKFDKNGKRHSSQPKKSAVVKKHGHHRHRKLPQKQQPHLLADDSQLRSMDSSQLEALAIEAQAVGDSQTLQKVKEMEQR